MLYLYHVKINGERERERELIVDASWRSTTHCGGAGANGMSRFLPIIIKGK